ncbi:hypothetical protein [Pseudomonas sp. URMO17WK12:I11]|uniref:hypothetical protein n=1 Tax=Pseudomonas sp. URMO17WK12:I11 TaxID=1283291 RepID=UPI0018DA1A02|nr:hypothetical protein [Pseudomonas sp. URMO17WK12:I11]MBH3362861.1 hypothetical protein [Pseudomonas sp. URMO17WK12:I11]
MSTVVRSQMVESLHADYDKLIDNYRALKEKCGSGASVESTKLWHYKKELGRISEMDLPSIARLFGITNKYCALNEFFRDDRKVIIEDQKLIDLLGGKFILDDENEKYNHSFFEVSMAGRFSKVFPNSAEIDLSTECDVVISSQGLAIECKYLHSEKKFRNEFSDGASQLNKRIQAEQAEVGIIALDISNLVDRQRIFEFSQNLFSLFVKNYELLVASRCSLSHGISVDGVSRSVVADKNFISLIKLYVGHELEMVFHRNFKKSECDKLSNEIFGVFYQANLDLCFEYEGCIHPVPLRSAGYFVNMELEDAVYTSAQDFFRSMAVGN